MNSTTNDVGHPITEPPKRSRLGRVIKWFVILSSGLVIGLIATVLLLLTFFFPSELARQELEIRASELLQGEFRITSLSFNALTGFELQQVEFLTQEKSLLSLKRLYLDYSLLGLLYGRLNINEVLIDQADIAINLPELAALKPEEEAPPAPQPVPSPEEVTLPALPLSIDLNALAIKQSKLNVVVSPTFTVDLNNVNLDVSGGLQEEGAELDGSLKVQDITLDLDDQHLRLPLHVIFSLAANLPSQELTLHELTVQSDLAVRLTLSGTIQEFLTNKQMNLSLHDVELDLEKLLALVKDFVPPDFRTITLNGIVSPTLHLKGSLPESEFLGQINLALEAKDLKATLPPFSTKLDRTDISLEVSDLNIRENQPEFGGFKVSLSNEAIQYQDNFIRDFHLDLTNEFFAEGPISGELQVSGVPTISPVGPMVSLSLPIQVHLSANGNFKSQDLGIKDLRLKFGDLITVRSRGEVHPQKPDSQGYSVSLTTRLEPHIANLLTMVPEEMLEGLSIKKGSAPDVILVNVTGALDPEYFPNWGKLKTQVKLTDLTTSLDTLPAGGTLNQANVLVSANYSRQSGQISATVGTALQLSDLHHGGSVAVGKTELKLKSSLAGTLSSDFELTSLRSKDMMTIQIADIVYDDPSLKAGIEQVRLSLKTQEDILGQEYIVEDLHVNSDHLLEATFKGRHRMSNQEFSVNAEIPYMNVGGLLTHLSGPLMQGLSEMNPQGQISLSVNASGRLPEQMDLDTLNIPVDVAARLELQNVEGAIAQHQVKGAGGEVSVSFTPGDHPSAKIMTDIQVNDIQLAPGLPVDRLSDAIVQLHVSAKDFEDVQITQFRVGAKGADLDVTGKVSGVQAFLKGHQELGEQLSQLFAQVTMRASMDLEQFQDVLKSAGLVGSGQAKLNISMLKKEEGPFDARLGMSAHGVSVSQEGRTIRNINGGLSLRKHLVWNPDSEGSSLPLSFNPTDVLSQLRSLSPKSNNLTIEHIDLGFLAISNLATHVLFERNAFKVQNLAMNLLSGGLGGNFILFTGQAFGLSAQIEVAQLDLNDLLDKELRITGDSRVDSTIGFTVYFSEENGALDLSKTKLNLYITHIGKEALDRLLVFLDPEGSRPVLVSARSQVKLANPSRVTIQMARGMMSLEILFDQGLLPPVQVSRIPVGKVKMLRNLTQGIPNWETLAQGLTLVGAETYGIDEEGKILLR